ncbi:MAG: thiol reductase thioredoxin [Actinobacteria bacterium]|nr:thiol reductase thioredoxin [Actinomycetota bacterium]
MATLADYHDKRSKFFKGYFAKALKYQDYLATGEQVHRQRWNGHYQAVHLIREQQELTSSFVRRLNVLFMSGIWCGDCVRQGPIVQRIAETNDLIDLRFIDNKENPELAEELRLNGASKVPVVVFLSEDFFELARFGDRHLAIYRSKLAKELGPACSTGLIVPEQDVLKQDLQDWLDLIERTQAMLRLAPLLRQRYGD